MGKKRRTKTGKVLKKNGRLARYAPPSKANNEAVSEALKGNQYWLKRSKHGRDKLFTSTELLWEAACEYFEYEQNNVEHEVKPMTKSLGSGEGSEIELVNVPTKALYTIHGLCIYLGCNTGYFRQVKFQLKDKDDKLSQDIKTVIANIEDVIFRNQFDGATKGFFNANIISQALGLVKKVDVTTAGESITPQAPRIEVYTGNAPKFDGDDNETKKLK